ncbi:MAG TPA: hypothetical protein VI757_05255 [Bacteroidia bacterium]|nr:hypothetical protein [Bacteroidia bacterium]
MFSLKKALAFFSILALIGMLASCKSHEKCPAYGKAQPAKHSTEKNS